MSGFESLLSGRTLGGRYHVEAVIGRGGMGAVYRAADERLGRAVAVKVVMVHAADAEARERVRQRFHREAQAAARLRHPNVVVVYDFGTDPVLGLDYLVMELLDGEDVAALLARAGPPPVETALDVLGQAARGLSAGHRSGLVHRDVKPGNLFLTRGEPGEEVHVKVLDFGIAQVTADDLTLTHLTVMGRGPLSPAYASPEQLRGESHLTPASDVYCLGVVGIQLLTGEKPLTGALDRREAEVAAALERLSGVAGVTAGVREVLARALHAEPRERFPDAAAFREALLSAGRGEASPVVVRPAAPPPAPERPPGPAPRVPPAPRSARRSRAWAAVLLVGLALLAVAVYAVTREHPRDGVAASAAGPDTLPAAVAVAPAERARPAPRQEAPPVDTTLAGVPVDTIGSLPESPPEEAGPRLYRIGEVEEAPRLRNRGEIRRRLEREYPRLLRDARVPGQTTVRFVIGESGRVDPASVEVVSSTHDAFNEPARRVVEQMEFSPGRISGEPVRVLAQMPITWAVDR